MRKLWLAAAVLLGFPVIARAQPVIWFAPLQDTYDAARHTVVWDHFDFLKMLDPASPWQTAAQRLDMIGFSTAHAVETYNRTKIPSLPAIQAMINRIKFKVAGGGSVIATGGRCKGAGTEGITDDPEYAREAALTTKGWHDAGLPMDAFVMDSPYYFAGIHMASQCHFTPEEVGQRAAATMKQIQALYPNIQVMDAEGPGEVPVAQFLPSFHRFLNGFKAAYGAPITAVHLDMHWADDWHNGYDWVTAVRQITDDLHKQGIKVALIIDAYDMQWDPNLPPPDPKADPRTTMTAQYWMAAVRKHIDMIKSNNLPLDAVAFASWMRFPTHNLPDSDQTAWTNAINYAHDVLRPGK
jgi:hypothetical protein